MASSSTTFITRASLRLGAGVDVGCGVSVGSGVPVGSGVSVGLGGGLGGATVNHEIDIWCSYITMADFREVDVTFVSGGDPEDALDVIERPKGLLPMSLPLRFTDGDAVNSINIMAATSDFVDREPFIDPDTPGDRTGTHSHGHKSDGLSKGFYEKVNEQGVTKQACITADGCLLDGNTGAPRPNSLLQKYAKNDRTVSAWAIIAREGSTGMGEARRTTTRMTAPRAMSTRPSPPGTPSITASDSTGPRATLRWPGTSTRTATATTRARR